MYIIMHLIDYLDSHFLFYLLLQFPVEAEAKYK